MGEHLLWFRRFDEGISPKLALNAEVEPDRVALTERLQRRARLLGAADRPLARRALCRPARLHHHARHACSLPFAATLAHVFNHGTHHRADITAALTALGQPCPELDLVYFLQTEAAAP